MTVAFALLLALAAQQIQAPQPPHELYEKGIVTLDQGEWEEALPIYREITTANPAYGWGWMGLAWSLHYTGDCRAALPAYERALDLGGLQPYRIMQEMARCHVVLGDHPAAIREISRALAAGYPVSERLRTDRSLEPLHELPAFRALFAPAVTGAPASDRVAGWRADLDLLEREIDRIHYSARQAFAPGGLAAAIDGLQALAAGANDEQMTLGVMRLLRRLDDGHTYAEPAFMRDESVALPLLFGYFEEGLFVTATTPAHDDLLWTRVLDVDGIAVDKVYAALAELVPQDNAWRPRSVAPSYMRYPPILHGLGLAEASDRMRLTVRDRAGAERTVEVGVQRGAIEEWVRRPADAAGAPARYVANRRDWYWFERLPGTGTIYVQYNACANQESESLAAFSRRLAAALEGDDIDHLIVDIRWNGGGNNFVTRPLLETITRAEQNRKGSLFVIAGPHTFSAAMIFAAQLERYTHAIFVGEPTGSSPNFVGETTFITLPSSKVRVSLSNLYWQTSHATDFRPWIPPMLYAPATFEGFIGGPDPAMAAIDRAYPLVISANVK